MIPAGSIYGLLMLAGIGTSLFLWTRLARADARLPGVYFSGLCGAFLGAKLAYLLAEGWQQLGQPDLWLQWATGKSIVGALLGGYAGVEIGKWYVGYPATTGDRFALVAPVGIIIGRIGCLEHGCCLGRVWEPAWYALPDGQGVPRWPAVPVEIGFNLAFLAVVGLVLRPRRLLAGQHFHLYLIAYGLFRLAHETLRDTPRILGPVSGYQTFAAGMAAFGIVRFLQRRRGLGGEGPVWSGEHTRGCVCRPAASPVGPAPTSQIR
jgi:phosphatidylglycerol---prolipoprotein diacylglyceryl transferase